MMDNCIAIIIGADHYNTLSVIRSLGEKNVIVNVILIGTKNSYVKWSKYISKIVFINNKEDEIYNSLLNMIRSLSSKPVIFPLTDKAAQVIDENYLELMKISYVPHAYGRMKDLQDKYFMGLLAKESGFTIPYKKVVKTKDKIEWDIFPAIIKPISGLLGNKTDIAIVDNKEELDKALYKLLIKDYDKVLIEEFIRGNDEYMLEILGFVKQNGEVSVSSLIKKIREYPLKGGSTSYATFIEEQEGLDISKLVELIKYTRFYGIFDIEFKYADGILYFIEINYRNGAPSYALNSKGCNIVYHWLCDAVGMPYKGLHRCYSGLFMCEHKDVLHVLRRNITIQEWFKEFRDKECIKIFYNKKDYLPFIFYWIKFISNQIALKYRRI